MNYDDFSTDLSWLNLEEVEVPKKATSTKKSKSSGREMTIGGLSFTIKSMNSGHKLSSETRARMSSSKKGIKLSESHCENLSAARKGIIFSESHRENISKATKGKKVSDLGRANMKIAASKRSGFSKKCKDRSIEVRTKFIMTPLGLFHGVAKAAEACNVNRNTIQRRTRYWPDQYFYLD